MRMDDNWETKVGRQTLGDGFPGVAVVVAREHADSRTIFPAAVVLHVESARYVFVARDLVHALAEFGIGIGNEAGTDAVVGCFEGGAAIFAHVVAAGRDAKVN